MKKFNHVFSLVFSLDSDNDGENITETELFDAIENRISILKKCGSNSEINEAFGLPDETHEN